MQLLFRGALPRIRAVLFDMDGLLIDSERLAQRSCLQAGRELGYPIDESVTRRLLGCTHEECERIISEALPGVDVLDYFKRSKRMLDESFPKELKAKPGAVTFVSWLSRHGIPYALASSSTRERIVQSLSITGLAFLFPVCLTGEDAAHSKPEPDLFLAAAARLGVSPRDCLVLEDSVNGIKAGRAAGSFVCMIPDIIPTAVLWPHGATRLRTAWKNCPAPFFSYHTQKSRNYEVRLLTYTRSSGSSNFKRSWATGS